MEQFLTACSNNNIKKVKEIVNSNPKFINKSSGKFKITPLQRAVLTNSYDVIRFLLKNNANPNKSTSEKITPLIMASVKGDLISVKLLLKYGANTNKRSIKGKTAIMRASQKGFDKIVMLLLNHGAKTHYRERKPDSLSCKNKKAFEMAKICGHKKVIRILSKKKINKAY